MTGFMGSLTTALERNDLWGCCTTNGRVWLVQAAALLGTWEPSARTLVVDDDLVSAVQRLHGDHPVLARLRQDRTVRVDAGLLEAALMNTAEYGDGPDLRAWGRLSTTLGIARALHAQGERYIEFQRVWRALRAGDEFIREVLTGGKASREMDALIRAARENAFGGAQPRALVWRELHNAALSVGNMHRRWEFDPEVVARVRNMTLKALSRVGLCTSAIWATRTTVAALLQMGADPNAGAGGAPALHLAAGRNGYQEVSALLQAGANVHLRGAHRLTALHWAANARPDPGTPVARANVATIELLMQSRAFALDVDEDGRNALHWAIDANDDLAIRALLKDGRVRQFLEFSALRERVNQFPGFAA